MLRSATHHVLRCNIRASRINTCTTAAIKTTTTKAITSSSSSFNTTKTTTTTFQESSHRCFVTSAQKRALKKEQLAGSGSTTSGSTTSTTAAAAKDATSTTSSTTATTATTATTTTTTATPKTTGGGPIKSATSTTSGSSSGGGGSGSGGLLVPVAMVAAAGGGAYYMGFLDEYIVNNDGDGNGKKEEVKSINTPPAKKETPVKPKVETKASKVEKVDTSTPTTVVKKEVVAPIPNKPTKKTKKTNKESDSTTINKVVTIQVPPKMEREITPPPPVQHDPDAHKVTTLLPTSSTSTEPKQEEEVKEQPTEEGVSPLPAYTQSLEKELTLPSSTWNKTEAELQTVHAKLRANLEDSYLKDIESLSLAELKIRVVQLSMEMKDQSKWEAVRMKEFLSLKEKEVSDRYMEIIQKQRNEFEDILARRLREQEGQLQSATQSVLEAKEASITKLVEETSSAIKNEHEKEISSLTKRLELEYIAKYEKEYDEKLAKIKRDFVEDTEQMVSVMEELKERLKEAEHLMEISRNFESGSQRAHRVSAAALALAEKMETSLGAEVEVAALKEASHENGVIAAALTKVPMSIKSGVPTLSELQTSFDKVYDVGRQAAHVPTGQKGLEGQLAGMLFAKLTVPPSHDSLPPPPPPEDSTGSGSKIIDSKMTEYILARAKHYVKVGELQEAVDELDKLEGQTSFTVRDWKANANDRIAVEKALKVIKMECAILNKTMAG